MSSNNTIYSYCSTYLICSVLTVHTRLRGILWHEVFFREEEDLFQPSGGRKVQINLNRKPTKYLIAQEYPRNWREKKTSLFPNYQEVIWLPECYLLALDAKPQHVLPVGNIWVFLNEVSISRQQELPAPVYPRHCNMLQELLHILRRKLRETHEEEVVSSFHLNEGDVLLHPQGGRNKQQQVFKDTLLHLGDDQCISH